MAYTPHALVSFGGSWTDQVEEIWACNVRLSSNGGGGVTLDAAAYMSDIATPLSTWFGGAASGCGADAKLLWLKVNLIGADGKYSDPGLTNLHTYAGTTGASGTNAPSFCTLAVSWSTAIMRGPAHHGRVYLPNNSYVCAAGGSRVSTTDRDKNATAGKALLTVLRNASGADGRKGTPVIASNIGGAIQSITGVSSDDVYDVQRRRKNRIKGTRSAVLAFP